MIQLDSNFQTEKAKTGGQYSAPPAGPYIWLVTDVSEAPSKDGKPMVTLTLDVYSGPEKGCFEKFPKKYRQLVNGDNMPYFKGMLEAFKASNPQEKIRSLINQQLHFFPMVLKGCIVGGMLRDHEYKQKDSGEIKVGQEIAYLFPVSEVGNLKPMPLKKLSGSAGHPQSYGGSVGAPPPESDDMPF